jgi:RNA polymerase sigma factor (sigma-70 family)
MCWSGLLGRDLFAEGRKQDFDLMSPTDGELVKRVLLLNDRTAYCGLVQRHQAAVRAYLLRLTRNPEWANDLAQEAFLDGYRKLNQLKDQTKFRSWVFSIAHSQFLQWHRSTESFDRELDRDGAHATDFFAATEATLLLKGLRPEEQSALTLCLAHDFTHAETAQMLNLPLGTTKSLILRAKEKLGGQV